METDPVPAYFSLRYIAWVCWSNPITILGSIQAIFQAATLPNPETGQPFLPLSHAAVHWIAIANLMLIILIAQLRKHHPPGPPPTSSKSRGKHEHPRPVR